MSGAARSAAKRWKVAAEARYLPLRARFDRSLAGVVQRRISEAEVTNKAMILAALALLLFIPALVSLVAILPLGGNGSVAAGFARRLGLTPQATADVQKLFGTKQTVRGSTTVLGAVFTTFLAYGWPAELRRGYEFIWQLPNQGRRQIWRPLLWLVAFIGVVGISAAIGASTSGASRIIVYTLVMVPLLCLWSWWSVHLLLGGRISWQALIPTAIITGCCLGAFRGFTLVYLSRQITSNFDKYGPIGVVFALLSWMIWFAVVLLGAPLVGEIVYQRRQRDADGAETEQSSETEQPSGTGAAETGSDQTSSAMSSRDP